VAEVAEAWLATAEASERLTLTLPYPQAALVAEVAEAWRATADAGEGVFDWRYDPAATAAAGAAANPDAGGLTRRIAAHHAWLAFLGEAWQARPGGGGPPPDAPPPLACDARAGCSVSLACKPCIMAGTSGSHLCRLWARLCTGGALAVPLCAAGFSQTGELRHRDSGCGGAVMCEAHAGLG